MSDEPNQFNPAAIERLIRLGGGKFAVEMMDLFSSYGGKKLAEARQARQSGNLTALADAAHPLKSSAGNVGAARVQELAAQVESSAREQKAELAGAQLDELERAFAEARTFLETEKSKLVKPPS
jgi:HPt (histidine-containing phosphotransfer) domain-containing protein